MSLDFLDEDARKIISDVKKRLEKLSLKIDVRYNENDKIWDYFSEILDYLSDGTNIKVTKTKANIEETVISMGQITFIGIPTGDIFGVFINTLLLFNGIEIEGIDFSKIDKRVTIVTFAGENCPFCATLSYYTNIIATKTKIKHVIVNVDKISDSLLMKIADTYKIKYVPVQVILKRPIKKIDDILNGEILRIGGEEYFDKYVEFLEAKL